LENIKMSSNSSLIANNVLNPATMNSVAVSGGRMRMMTGTVSVADSEFDAATDIIRLCKIPSNAVIHNIIISCEDMDGGAESAADLGIWESGDSTFITQATGTAVLIDAYLADSTIFRAAVAQVDCRYVDGGVNAAALGNTTAGATVWENAGLTTDPGAQMYELVFSQKATVSADGTGPFDIAFQVIYTID
jgi:hypothetical protein